MVLLTSLVASLACQALTGGRPPGTGLPTPSSQPGTEPPVGPATETSEGSAAVSGEAEFGPGDFNLIQARVGLADLASYQATLVLAFDGSHNGEPQQWSRTYVLLAAQDAAARQLSIENEGDLDDLEPELLAERDGVAYAWGGEQGCSGSALEPGTSLIQRLEPAGLLASVIGADAAGSQAINGVAADHYTFDERALGELGLAESAGELWLAADEGYVIRYLLTTVGTADYFGDGLEGTLTWDYELTEANEPVSLDLPGDCPPGMVNAPLLPDASNVVSVPGLLAYQTGASPNEAAAFYQEQIPELGWEIAVEPAVEPAGAVLVVRLDFAQGDQTMTVVIAPGDSLTDVQIVLGRPS